MSNVDQHVKAYLSRIGRKGGLKSRRTLLPADAQRMVRVREARKAFKVFRAQCFWSAAPDYRPGLQDIEWISDQLRKNGGRAGWRVAKRLCP